MAVWHAAQSPGEIKRREVELDSHEELDNHLRVQARSRGGRWSWTLMKSWTIICGSRRDQEEGGGAGLSWRAGQSFAGPGEIKRREVEMDSREELDNHLRVQARSRGGRWRWTLVKSWTIICGSSPVEIKNREVELGSELKLNNSLLQLFFNSCPTDIVCVILFRTNVETTISEVHKLRVSTGEVPTLLSVLAAADGLFGLCGSERRADELFTCSVSPLSLRPFPPSPIHWGLELRCDYFPCWAPRR